MELKWKPIVQWPGERTKIPKRSQFSANYTSTLQLIDDELRHLRAKNIVLQADCDESEIRLDGRLRAKAVMKSQGIILSLDSMHGPLSWACDRYTSWEDNLRAIGLTMQALRAVSRYGVVRESEQYKGFKALPAPSGQVQSTSVQRCADWLAELINSNSPHASVNANDLTRMALLYVSCKRRAQSICHPDRCGGDRALWDAMSDAFSVLDKHHNVA